MSTNENLMQMYYAMQPDALRRTADEGETLLEGIRKALKGLQIQKVFLLGIGSSFHSARLAEHAFRELSGLPVESVTPETAHLPERHKLQHAVRCEKDQIAAGFSRLYRDPGTFLPHCR